MAATLAAALAALNANNSEKQRLIDEPVLNSVIVLTAVRSVLGPIMTELFGRRPAAEVPPNEEPTEQQVLAVFGGALYRAGKIVLRPD